MTNKYHNPAAAQMIAIIFAVIFFNCTVKLFAYDDWEKTKSPFCWNFTCFGEDRGGRVFAGSWGDGLYQLSGSGTTWTKVSTNLQDPYITCMFIDSSNKIFVGTYGSGVCYSTDYGVHWIQTTNGLENLSIKTIIKNVAGNLLVGTNNGGIFRSTNLGVTWLPANHGLWYQDVNSLCLSINGGICAATNGGGFYYSKDDGKTWVRSNATTTGTNYRIDYAYQMLAKIDGNIYATTAHRGIVYSPDGGIQWYELDSLGMKSYNMYAITTNPALLIVAGTRTTGISYYDDKLYNMWKQSDFFTSGPDALFRTSTGTMFAAMPIEGIYSSSDGGKTWKKHSFNNATGLVALTQGKNGLAFCGRTPTGLSISTDYGKSWANAGLDTNTIFCVAIDSSNNILVGAPSGIYKSTNNGGIWTFLGLASMSPKYISVLRNGNIIASANDFNISTNAGVTWKKITIAKDALGNAFGCEFTAGNYNNDIYASAGGNLFKSTNAGTNWTNLSNDVAPLNTLSMNFDYQGNIYASCQWNGLYISTNNGTSWTGDKMGKANVYFLATAFNTQNKLVNIQRVTNGIGGTWIRKSPNNWDSLNSNMTIIDMQSLSTNSLGYTYATTDAIYSRIDSNKLIPPNLLAPASNTTGLNINPSFSWTSSSFAEAYNFEIANDPSFPYSMEYRTQSSTTVTLERPLYYATTYYWRVRAKYNNSLSEWSNVRAFTTIIPPPNLISPADGARGVKRKHDLVWNSVITATNYDYQVATDTLFSSIISTQTFIPDTTVNLTLQDYTQYFWRARAAAGTAYGPWSKYRRYLTAVAPPQLTSPADKSSGMDTVVVMTWDTSVASTKYIILISKSPDFSPDSIIYEGTTDENNRHRMPLLQFNKTYWWKIKAGNDDGYGEFCDPWSYTTGIMASSAILGVIQPV
ncbi:MAG: hypothetical protein NT007_05865 [Candidatus Kapabacteria bacterium]|nr:hypothetical protein [Candidatus Kapabacteria bacterium]